MFMLRKILCYANQPLHKKSFSNIFNKRLEYKGGWMIMLIIHHLKSLILRQYLRRFQIPDTALPRLKIFFMQIYSVQSVF